MLGLILVIVWMAFVAGYLIWQFASGDLAGEAAKYQQQPATAAPRRAAPAPRRAWAAGRARAAR